MRGQGQEWGARASSSGLPRLAPRVTAQETEAELEAMQQVERALQGPTGKCPPLPLLPPHTKEDFSSKFLPGDAGWGWLDPALPEPSVPMSP